jgi:hypothetical protein
MVRDMNRAAPVLAVAMLLPFSSCTTSQLSGGGAQVATSQSAPVDSGWEPNNCKSLGYVVGHGGGSFGGGWISNDQLIEYAMNDLRNKASELGANFVQHDTPTMGQSGSNNTTTTSTATVSGTAYLCEKKTDETQPVVAANDATESGPRACTPGVTQECVGPAGCKGGQFCVDDGSKYSKCDCGSTAEQDSSEADNR